MQELLVRLLGFDKLIGPVLVKLVYWSGLAGIGLFVFAIVTMGLMSLAAGNFVSALVQLVGALAVGAAMLVYWRFVCELFMIAFKAFERLGEIRDRLSGETKPPADFPQF